MITSELIRKYDVPAPRYTSYPTVPYWETPLTSSDWIQHLTQAFKHPDFTFAMYIHIPFCESLCTYCGCNTTITKDHGRETGYVSTLLKEWNLYLRKIPEIQTSRFRELHLGGGTPTFLSAQHLKDLLTPILQKTTKDSRDFEASIEVDPRRTSADQLQTLRELGFTRVSMGVQDFNPEVQKLVNRFQPVEITENLSQQARKMGYDSVNFDLIYGLPKQTPDLMKNTIAQTIRLKPDRIALYSFAYVPWIKPSQRLFTDEDLPVGADKRKLYEISRDALLSAGYLEIGMDHFALPSDSLAKAYKNGELHRNFMGYTHRRTQILLGLGVSSISETPTCFHQNQKTLPVYEREVSEGKIPTFRGHILTSDDQKRREQILEFMTQGRTRLEQGQISAAKTFLQPMLEDGLVRVEGDSLIMTDEGRPFMRNACVFFDERLRSKAPQTKIFSQSI